MDPLNISISHPSGRTAHCHPDQLDAMKSEGWSVVTVKPDPKGKPEGKSETKDKKDDAKTDA